MGWSLCQSLMVEDVVNYFEPNKYLWKPNHRFPWTSGLVYMPMGGWYSLCPWGHILLNLKSLWISTCVCFHLPMLCILLDILYSRRVRANQMFAWVLRANHRIWGGDDETPCFADKWVTVVLHLGTHELLLVPKVGVVWQGLWWGSVLTLDSLSPELNVGLPPSIAENWRIFGIENPPTHLMPTVLWIEE